MKDLIHDPPPPGCLQTTENSEPYVILCLFCIYMPMILFDIS